MAIMFLRIGPDGGLSLVEPSDFGRFHVQLTTAPERGAEALRAAGGELTGEGAVVPQALLRTLAGDAADAAWEQGFAAMVDYASTHGWVTTDGGLRAHVLTG
jgi:hypothetical protein